MKENMAIPQSVPLSPAQQDVLVEDALDAGGIVSVQRVARVFGAPAAADRVEHEWTRVLAMYPTLSARVGWRDGQPLQDFGGRPRSSVQVHLIEEYDGDAATQAAVLAGVDNGRDPASPFVDLHCIGDHTGVRETVLTYHRLLLDDQSAELLLVDLEQACADGSALITRPNVTDYLRWLDTWDQAPAEEFWKSELALIPGPTHLFGDTGERHTGCLELTTWPLSAAQIRSVESLAADLEVPARWLALAAWMVVAAVFRGEPSVTVGTLVDGTPEELAGAVGPFSRVLPVSGQPRAASAESTGDQSAYTWTAATCERLRAAIRHAHLPTARINELSQLERGRTLFDSAVDVRPAAQHRRISGGQELPLIVELVLPEAGDKGDVASVRLHYDPTRTSASLATRLARCTAVALADLGTERPIRTISLLEDDSRSAVLTHNATAADYPSERCLHQLVETQVARTPNHVAVRFGGASLSYAELDQRANRLAGYLIDLGVRPDTIVGLCAEPGFELVIAILAILKAGGAYAPLDPGFPPDRLTYLADDLDCPVVLVQQHLRHKLPQVADPVILECDEPWRQRSPKPPDVGVHPGNLAYVMYTSGSTGRPKGVLIEHRGSVNFVSWIASRYTLGPGEAALQWTAYSFDAAVWELFWPLIVGSTAVIAPAGIHLDLARFTRLIREENVATLHFVPAMLQTFLTAPEVSKCRSLRHVFVSGEPIPAVLLEKFHSLLPGQLINLYGVTEVSIDSTFYECPRDALEFVRSGRPLQNTATYVLDGNVEPAPFDARAEIFIGGDSVTRGYLGRPALTASRFVPDPFAAQPGARMYRTGDVATLLEDGHLRFLGRNDHQVKIRGIRVELLEAQAEADAYPGIRECLVVPWGEGSARSLALYAVPSESRLDERELREFLSGRLPSYLVPTVICLLDAFPLTATGKLDRTALPDPHTFRSERHEVTRERTATEDAVALIWAEVLGGIQVDVDDDFFAIGGNSLLATRVISDVRKRFGVDLPLRAWLESNSVAKLAMTIDRRRTELAAAQALLDEIS